MSAAVYVLYRPIAITLPSLEEVRRSSMSEAVESSTSAAYRNMNTEQQEKGKSSPDHVFKSAEPETNIVVHSGTVQDNSEMYYFTQVAL